MPGPLRLLLLISASASACEGAAQERRRVDTTPAADARLRELMNTLPQTDDDGATLLFIVPAGETGLRRALTTPVTRKRKRSVRLRLVDPNYYQGKRLEIEDGAFDVKDR